MQIWSQGDVVSRGLLVLLWLMSCLSWSVIVLKAGQYWLWRRQVNAWPVNSPPTTPANDRMVVLWQTLAHAYAQHSVLPGKWSLHDWLQLRMQPLLTNFQHEFERGLPLLATIASTAPFVGLLGTVWGVYHALLHLGQQQQVTLNQMATPIGEALVMTALGLAVAIPAVVGYNLLRRASQVRYSQCHQLTQTWLIALVQGE